MTSHTAKLVEKLLRQSGAPPERIEAWSRRIAGLNDEQVYLLLEGYAQGRLEGAELFNRPMSAEEADAVQNIQKLVKAACQR